MAAEIVSEENCGTKKIKVRFSLSFISEDDLEMEGHQELPNSQPELKDEDIEDDCFYDDNEMLVSLANMSFNLVVDQDHNTDEPLYSCDHQFNEIVVMPEQADFAFISAVGRMIKEHDNLFLKSHQKCKYITSERNQIHLADTMSAKITIFQCMATKDTEPGVPVVLNFTDTDKFFCCTNEGGQMNLKVTRYDKTKLHTSGDDEEKLAHVFYMSRTPDGLRHFESALHRGWFIHTVGGNAVKMQRGKLTSSNSFVLIETDTTKIIEY
ncbi:uncharacterized protein LOC127522325 [Ctenopharyngodon idella]|uniref:uncharacterized protein LOC127522325 n=1 Tax=Ctenopharyngodon idella TaxID=7959 RepID=UPI0022306225|nr:uncharacterized protein LOC127522325 [Ctenopharyngodon idella]